MLLSVGIVYGTFWFFEDQTQSGRRRGAAVPAGGRPGQEPAGAEPADAAVQGRLPAAPGREREARQLRLGRQGTAASSRIPIERAMELTLRARPAGARRAAATARTWSTQDSSSGRTIGAALDAVNSWRIGDELSESCDIWRTAADVLTSAMALVSAVVSAQGEAPGMRPAAGAAVEPDAGRAAARSAFEQRLERAAAARPAVHGRSRPRREARRLLRPQAGGAGVRVLRVPDAVHAGAERPRRARCGVLNETSARSSTSSRSASTRARRRCWRRRRSRRTSTATSGPRRRRAGTS